MEVWNNALVKSQNKLCLNVLRKCDEYKGKWNVKQCMVQYTAIVISFRSNNMINRITGTNIVRVAKIPLPYGTTIVTNTHLYWTVQRNALYKYELNNVAISFKIRH